MVLCSRIRRSTLQHRIWTKNLNYNIACMLHWMWSKRSVPSAKHSPKTQEICTLACYTQPNVIRCMLSADTRLRFCSLSHQFNTNFVIFVFEKMFALFQLWVRNKQQSQIHHCGWLKQHGTARKWRSNGNCLLNWFIQLLKLYWITDFIAIDSDFDTFSLNHRIKFIILIVCLCKDVPQFALVVHRCRV